MNFTIKLFFNFNSSLVRLKARRYRSIFPWPVNFNSSLVRLKVAEKPHATLSRRYFNSSLVRLKGQFVGCQQLREQISIPAWCD